MWYFFLFLLECLVITSVTCSLPGQSEDDSGWLFSPEIVAYITAALIIMFSNSPGAFNDTPAFKPRARAINRQRRTVLSMFEELGPVFVRRAYRMDEAAFWILHQMLAPTLRKQGSAQGFAKKKHRNGARNGLIHSSLRLSMVLRYFAGGSVYDIVLVHGVSHCQVFRSVWRVLDAINLHPGLAIKFPQGHAAQKKIADGFKKKSQAGFDCCVGCIDGILIWTEKPSPSDCLLSTCGAKKFLCGRKKKFGLNMQAVCDEDCRFLDVAICHPGSTSDYLAFATSPLRHKMEQDGFLAPGLCLFGDNAYVNTSYMVTPYKGVSAGTKDDYNFYQSQVRIKVECAFGMLVHRWAILRRAIACKIGLTKTTALVMGLCRLHNFCIDHCSSVAATGLAQDNCEIESNGEVALLEQEGNVMSPDQLLHGGEHQDDVNRHIRAGIERLAAVDQQLPCDKLHDVVLSKQLRRPPPQGWRM